MMAEDCHILVVEDDPRLRERLARYLSGEGFRVTAAAESVEARTQ
jgi:two-component system phosphate regulon response regulator OmpR